jgi:catechol 2,3-dioxygenase-like lactoylglutathione lyase family enzyme
MPVRIQKLDHFAVYVTNLERSEKFYREHLGMSVHARIGTEQVVLNCGDTLLALFAKPDLQTPVEPGAPADPLGRVHFAVNVNAKDWHAARAEYKAAGIPVSEPINWGDHECFYITDPDGNLIELMSWRRSVA